MIVHRLTSCRPQLDGLDQANTLKLSDPKYTKFWTLQPITPERFIRFELIWLENDCGGFSFKIEYRSSLMRILILYVYNDQNITMLSLKK